MLKIRAIKIEVNTSSGLFGAEYEFTAGLNIIRGDNSSGKSSLFQSILYGLGFEELLGGKNEKTMQSALKDQVEFPKNRFHNVIQSFVYLEIENEEIITVKRSVSSEFRKAQLVDVYFGPLLTGEDKTLESRPMYIHDKGGATDEIFGFHLFLSEFLGWDLPDILTTKGDYQKLYLQQIAPTFTIEQKTGWSDFFATMPYYSMRDLGSRVIEFILNLDVFENEKRKQKINSDKQNVGVRWTTLYHQFQELAQKSGGDIKGLDQSPAIINDFGSIYIAIQGEDKSIPITDYNEMQKQELQVLERNQINTVGGNVKENEEKLRELTEKLNQYSLNYEMLSPELSFDKEKLKQYEIQKSAIEKDLRKNKGALKVKKLGADLPAETALDHCPTCHQELRDSLLPTDIKQTPMRIEDNINFLDAQRKMIDIYVEGQQQSIREKERKLNDYQARLITTRQEIRNLKRELTQDERLPSIIEIEKRLNLKKKIEFFTRIIEDFSKLLEQLRALSVDYSQLLSNENNLPTDFFSGLDREKLIFLQNDFISYLRKFNYQSKPFEAIKISFDNYLPVAQKIGADYFYNIKFDSSASDFIRCIWAYTISLLTTSIKFNSNHPGLLLMDEPKQQDISLDNFRSFLMELSVFKDQQILVFASFENSDISFQKTTESIYYSLNIVSEKLIKPLK